jgi:hypothetical protein
MNTTPRALLRALKQLTQLALLLSLSLGLLSAVELPEASAKPAARANKSRAKGERKKKPKEPIEVPVEVGIGPAGHILFGELQNQQSVYYGARINVEAVIDKALIQRFKNKVPKKYRKYAEKLNEVRVRPGPLFYVPRTLIISPGEKSSMYGAAWDFIGAGTGLGPLKLNANVQLIYAYLSYQNKAGGEESMHLLRPSLALEAMIPIKFNDTMGMNIGWRSSLMPPQRLGASPIDLFSSKDVKKELTNIDDSIWHMGQAFVMFYMRFPYVTKL